MDVSQKLEALIIAINKIHNLATCKGNPSNKLNGIAIISDQTIRDILEEKPLRKLNNEAIRPL